MKFKWTVKQKYSNVQRTNEQNTICLLGTQIFQHNLYLRTFSSVWPQNSNVSLVDFLWL